MTYAMLEEKLKSMPEECIKEIMDYADYVLFRYEKNKRKNVQRVILSSSLEPFILRRMGLKYNGE